MSAITYICQEGDRWARVQITDQGTRLIAHNLDSDETAKDFVRSAAGLSKGIFAWTHLPEFLDGGPPPHREPPGRRLMLLPAT